MTTVYEIVELWLKENGYDGLCDSDEECGCLAGDLAPCCHLGEHCVAGHSIPSNDPHTDWIVKPGKRPAHKR